MRRIVVPRHPGVLSAAGLLAAPVEHEAAAAFIRRFAASTSRTSCVALRTRLAARLRRADAQRRRARRRTSTPRYFADVCYVGQSYHMEVALDLQRMPR